MLVRALCSSDHDMPVAENILNRNFVAERPGQKMVSDITYIPTDEGWLYLAGVMICADARWLAWQWTACSRGLLPAWLKQGKGICGGEAMVVHGAVIIEQMALNACKWSFNRWSMTLGR